MDNPADPGDTDQGPPDPQFPNPADEDRPLSDRLERDPSNLGDDVPEEGDLVFPLPEPATPHM